MLVLAAIFSLGVLSCSEDTVDNIGRDTALNIIRANKWFDVIQTTTISGGTPETKVLVGEGGTLEFKSDNFAYVFTGGETVSYPYTLETNKRMVFDGKTYEVQESIIQTVTRLTLVNNEAGVTTTIVFRRR
ncbi:hypothetical protein DI53_1485 [Sphingobacterium deserti]|uniref:Lipocalin-like domain-containing protein n=2 Tax=Sphingobacterium deserti TaxID=1229276 RepID=A0A0B8T199_9SPHI|nr:hypothetical protein DI53_1485 [Sphingobacterium deserti]